MAQIAFAARCARRVQPLFVHFQSDAPQNHIDNVDKAIALAEALAVGPAANERSDVARAADVRTAAAAAHDAHLVRTAEADTHHAHAAAEAVEVATALATATVAAAAAAVTRAAHAASDFNYGDIIIIAIRSDYNLLDELAKGESDKLTTESGDSIVTEQGDKIAIGFIDPWTDDTPVPPEIFGPMWPEGKPKGWPQEKMANKPCCLKIEISSPSGLNESESKDFNKRVAAFFIELSALHIGMGGNGLELIEQDSCESTLSNTDYLAIPTPPSRSGVGV